MIAERLTHIDRLIDAPSWPALIAELDQRIAELTAQLVNADNEQTRGRIKALHDIKNLPVALQAERDGIRAALSQEDAAI